MASLKSITELPVAESAEGLNLIVNDNGAAKQIAASAVGAQADFAVTDETSPAFIKNKPAVAQADWGMEDTTNPAFIKNRPFYDTREFKTVTLTFDGDLTGKEFTQMADDGGYIKLSGNVCSKEELIGSILKVTTPDGVQTLEITEEMIMINGGMIGIMMDGDMPVIIVIPQELIAGNMPFTSAGIWATCGLQDGVPVYYVSEFSWTGIVSGELKKIDEKYVPGLNEWDLDIVITGTVDSDGNNEDPTYMINYINTYENIKDKIFNGISPKCKVKAVCHIGDINSPAAVESFNFMFTTFIPEGFEGDGSPEYITFCNRSDLTSPFIVLLPDGAIPVVGLYN